MGRFTADEALDLRYSDEAIMLDFVSGAKICENHDTYVREFIRDTYPNKGWNAEEEFINAGDLFAWLGY